MSTLDVTLEFRNFVGAWEQWDARSGNEDLAAALVVATTALSVRWNTTSRLIVLAMQMERRADPGGSVVRAAERMRARLEQT